MAEARNPELEKLILNDPEDPKSYAVYGDWLQERGELRGELIALQLAGKEEEAKALIDDNVDYFLGPLAPHQLTYDGELGNNGRVNTDAWVEEHQKTFLWKNGFIHRVRLAHNDYDDRGFDGRLADVLKLVLAHPSARFVVQMNFMENGDPTEDSLDDLFEIIEDHPLPTLRKLVIGDNVDQISWYHVGEVGILWPSVPNLRELEIEAGTFDLGTIDLPKLERAIFRTGGLAASNGKAIATAKIPNIRHLEIYYGTDRYGGECSLSEVKPLLDRTDLPSLKYLGLKNAEFTDEIAKAIGTSKIVAQLETLDLSLGTLGDEGALALAQHKVALKHLKVLDLSHHYCTQKGLDAVKGICANVITNDLQQASVYGNEEHRYCAVSE